MAFNPRITKTQWDGWQQTDRTLSTNLGRILDKNWVGWRTVRPAPQGWYHVTLSFGKYNGSVWVHHTNWEENTRSPEYNSNPTGSWFKM